MKQLLSGEFFGQTNKTTSLEGLTLTDTIYTHDKVDWHYHKNAYFTFILEGNVIEGNKKEVYHCPAGSLLFHNWQDPHYNIKPEGFTRGFHLEIEEKWFDDLLFNKDNLQGSINISDPDLKIKMYKIFTETKLEDNASVLSIQSLLLDTFSRMFQRNKNVPDRNPSWTNKIREILNDGFSEDFSLQYLSHNLGVHPVHISREFSRYFNCTLGEYLRKLKVEKSLMLLSNKQKSLIDIAFECGFSDQSHFNRCFKEFNGISPSAYRKIFFS